MTDETITNNGGIDVNVNASNNNNNNNASPTDSVPPSPVPDGYVRLVSGDGFSFTVDREYACASSVIDAMLRSAFKESHTRIIHLPGVSGRVLAKVCDYFYYVRRFQHQHGQNRSTSGGSTTSTESTFNNRLPLTTTANVNPNPNSIGRRNTYTRPYSAAAVEPQQQQQQESERGDGDTEVTVETFPIPSDLSVDVFHCAKYLDL